MAIRLTESLFMQTIHVTTQPSIINTKCAILTEGPNIHRHPKFTISATATTVTVAAN